MTRTQSELEELVASLTLEEKVLLTAGEDLFSTPAVERAGLPKVRLTDGPNGARGAFVPGGDSITAACVPCGAALGATWNVELVERVGSMLGEEARTKACRVLLAPTVNLHRSPLAGRNFECYSEDPLLTGKLAAAFVRGVQSQDVATTVKHFVGNDAEFERHTINSVIDERTLPRALPGAVRAGGPRGRRPRRDDRVQPVQRAVRHRERRAAPGDPARRVGLQRLRAHRLVRSGLDGRRERGGARPGDAGPGTLLRTRARRRGQGR